MNEQQTNDLLRGMLQGVQVNQLNILTGEHAQVTYNGTTARKADTLDENQKDTLAKLIPICYGSEEVAAEFLTSIQGMKPTQITAKVNQMVNERKISDLSRKRDLWMVLHESGIYQRSEANWNDQVK